MKTDKKKITTPVSSCEPVKRRGVNLKSETDVRRFLIKLVRAHLDGEMTPDSLRASVYALNSVLTIFTKFPEKRGRVFYGHPVGNIVAGGNDDTEEPDDSDDEVTA